MGRKSNYSEAYKREAVAKAEASGNVSQTARELGISTKSLHTWIKEYGEPLDVNTADEKELSARVKSFFATVKLEAIPAGMFASRQAACMALFDYIEVFYNRQRLHSGMEYARPVSRAA